MLIISDTHSATPMALHELESNRPWSDEKLGSAAMRPPQLEQWSISILEWILRQPQRPKVVVHLGDVGNVACRGEYSRFARVMTSSVKDEDSGHWYMAPGNHDTLVMGNWAYLADAPPADFNIQPSPWNRECAGITPEGSMDKKVFFEDYLASKHWTQKQGITQRSGLTCAQIQTNDPAARAEICWREPRDRHRYWWFLLQEIQVNPEVTLLLLDTTQYASVPVGLGGWNPGGVRGGVGWEQLEEARRWLRESHHKQIVVAGHFPLDSMDPRSERRLKDFIAEFAVVTYLSGHVHAPSNERIHDDMSGFLEINMASTMGWPMEYGYLSVRASESEAKGNSRTKGNFRSIVELAVAGVPVQLQNECDAMSTAFKEQKASGAYYLDYKIKNEKGKWVNNYDRVRSAMYTSLYKGLPAETGAIGLSQDEFAKRELSEGIRPSEMSDKADAVKRIEAYERCQAIWASELESNPSSKPSAWQKLPPVQWFKDHFDDPPPKRSELLREPSIPLESWRWMVDN